MVSGDLESLIHSVRISSVGPGKSIGCDAEYFPSGVDLAMKLHYIKVIYFFDSPAYRDLRVPQIKESAFALFNDYFAACGRFRRAESGRPYIKCNDCGARFIEAECGKTVEDWLEMDGDDWCAQKLLVSQQVIGPELQFSPLIYIQLTRFKCGGISIGLSWAHVLGDAFSAVDFMNKLLRLMFHTTAITAAKPLKNPQPPPPAAAGPPLSLRKLEPVGDHWLPPNNHKMETLSFQLTATRLAKFQTRFSTRTRPDRIPAFESVCAVVWRLVAKLRRGAEPTTVTVCKLDPTTERKILSNSQRITTVKAEIVVSEADPRELAELLVAAEGGDEREAIEEAVERENGVADFVLYGANLTFVKWDEANFYGHGLGFESPRFVNYTVQGVGEEGAVLVLPGAADGGGGRFVSVILPESEIAGLRSELTAAGVLEDASNGFFFSGEP